MTGGYLSMLTVLIAEDEEWIRKGIVTCIDWEGLGLQLAAEASNGNIAIELARRFKPDIILIDIRMPVHNGLEVMESIKSEGNHPKFIIISGFDHFEYAKKAISLGAFAYLLKPIKRDEVNQTLASACQILLMEKELQLNLEHAANQLRASVPIVKESILMDLLIGRQQQQKHQELATFSPYYAVLVIGLNNYITIRHDQEDADERIQKILLLTESILSNYEEGIVFVRKENCLVVVLGLQSDELMVHLEVGKRILQEMHQLDTPITIGAGGIYHNVANIKQSYDEAMSAYREKIVVGGGSLITRWHSAALPLAIPEEQLKALCLALELADIRGIRFGIQVLFNLLTNQGSIGFELIYKLISRLYTAAIDVAARYGIDEAGFHPSDLDYMETVDCLLAYLNESLMRLSEKIIGSKEKNSVKAITAAVEFIHAHYSGEISLDMIATYVKLNPSYFSEMFRKEMGVTFTEYLANVRIEKAKRLLLDSPHISIGKVAESVGYANTRYFSSLFTKRTGYKPSEYKERQAAGWKEETGECTER
jgi:two-component system response regulator YesN